MYHTTPRKQESNKLLVSCDPTKCARGHQFMALLRRGGKVNPRKSRRTARQKFMKENRT